MVGSIINALGCLMQTNTTAITLPAPNASAKELYQQHFQTTRTYKNYKFFTEVNHLSAYGSINRLIKETVLKRQTVENYLTHNSTYTNFKQTRHSFSRLKVQSYRLNEIWSLDLSDMQSLANDNRNTRYLLVAVDTLSRFLRV